MKPTHKNCVFLSGKKSAKGWWCAKHALWVKSCNSDACVDHCLRRKTIAASQLNLINRMRMEVGLDVGQAYLTKREVTHILSWIQTQKRSGINGI
jgi:hypothetical protein